MKELLNKKITLEIVARGTKDSVSLPRVAAPLTYINLIQVNLIITLSLGSIERERVIIELCDNEVIYCRHIAK